PAEKWRVGRNRPLHRLLRWFGPPQNRGPCEVPQASGWPPHRSPSEAADRGGAAGLVRPRADEREVAAPLPGQSTGSLPRLFSAADRLSQRTWDQSSGRDADSLRAPTLGPWAIGSPSLCGTDTSDFVLRGQVESSFPR